MARLFDDGSNEYAEHVAAILAGAPFSVSVWFNSDDGAGDNQTIIGMSGASSYNARLFASTDGPALKYQFYDGSFTTLATSTFWSANTWHHALAVSAAVDDHSIYLDGAGKGTSATSITFDFSVRTRLGLRAIDPANTHGFSGAVAECALWSAALTDADAVSLAAGFSPLLVKPQSLVAYWHLFRDEDQDIVGGYDLTPVNTPSIAAHPPMIYPATPSSFVAAAAAAAGNPWYYFAQQAALTQGRPI